MSPEHAPLLEIGGPWLARRVWRSRVNTGCRSLLLEDTLAGR